jgi:hypothetical protein
MIEFLDVQPRPRRASNVKRGAAVAAAFLVLWVWLALIASV